MHLIQFTIVDRRVLLASLVLTYTCMVASSLFLMARITHKLRSLDRSIMRLLKRAAVIANRTFPLSALQALALSSDGAWTQCALVLLYCLLETLNIVFCVTENPFCQKELRMRGRLVQAADLATNVVIATHASLRLSPLLLLLILMGICLGKVALLFRHPAFLARQFQAVVFFDFLQASFLAVALL